MIIKPPVQWQNRLLRYVTYVLFFPLSLLFAFLLLIKNSIGKPRPVKNKVRVICIGSLSVGGSGKTPFVEWYARLLVARGLKLCVISNGYRKKSHGLVCVSDGIKMNASLDASGDEAYMMAINFLNDNLNIPVISSPNRSHGIDLAKKNYDPDIILLDDGFQDFSVYKDAVLCVEDYWERDYPQLWLPLGRLRDLKQNIKKCNAHVVTKIPPHAVLQTEAGALPFLGFTYYLYAMYDLDDRPLNFEILKHQKIIVLAGLGHNDAFLRTVEFIARDNSAEVIHFAEFHDHHWYSRADIRRILSLQGSDTNDYIVLTSQKDAIKVKKEWVPFGFRFFYLKPFMKPVHDAAADELAAIALRLKRQ